jgi:hypothetical protein
MPNLNVNILGRDGNTRAKVTGQEELLVSVGSISPVADLATETTLKSVENLSSLILAAIQAGTEYEAALVIDASDVTWLEIRVYNPDSGTFDSPVYYLAGSNTPGTPALPITYINPNTYLAQIVSNTTGLATEVTLGLLEAKDFATETTLALLEGKDFATETTLSNLDSKITACDTTNLATETTLLSVDSNAAQLVTNTTSVTRTPNLVRATGSGTIAPLVYDFSVSNVGSANGTILGGTIKPSETLNFTAGALNNSYAAGTISYDGTGTELVIIFNS